MISVLWFFCELFYELVDLVNFDNSFVRWFFCNFNMIFEDMVLVFYRFGVFFWFWVFFVCDV